MRCFKGIIAIALVAIMGAAEAGNRTLSGFLPMDADVMKRSRNNCGGPPSEVNYAEAGTIRVSEDGGYRFADAGGYINFFSGGRILDTMVLVYEGNFNPNRTEENLIGEYDFGQNYRNDEDPGFETQLQAGTDYIIVTQPWCQVSQGTWGVIIDGPGDITGDGFDSPADYRGTFQDADGTATFINPFSGEGIVLNYALIGPVMVDRDGYYNHQDIGGEWLGSAVELFVYEKEFIPSDTEKNLVARAGDSAGVVQLEGGKPYFFVVADIWEQETFWQFVLYPPGYAGFSHLWTGAWYNPATAGQGALMQSSTDLGFLFLALFTFDTADEAARTKAVGSSGQRWLTAYGTPSLFDRSVPLKYENSTGGAFDQAVPAPETDSSYGDGELEFITCNHIRLTYNLPGGLEGEMDLQRALPGEEIGYCDAETPIMPLQP